MFRLGYTVHSPLMEPLPSPPHSTHSTPNPLHLCIVWAVSLFPSLSNSCTLLFPPVQVPEIITTLCQASKSSERQEESAAAAAATGATSSLSSSCQNDKQFSDFASPNTVTFAKKFEVLFCGRVVVAHRKAPPALIDECIEKFSRASGGIGGLAAGIRRALSLQPTPNGVQTGAGEGILNRKAAFFQREPSLPPLQPQDENGLSPEPNTDGTGSCGVRPTSIQENRTMLFTVCTTLEYVGSREMFT